MVDQEKSVDMKCKSGSYVKKRAGKTGSRGIWSDDVAYCKKSVTEAKKGGGRRGRPKGAKKAA